MTCLPQWLSDIWVTSYCHVNHQGNQLSTITTCLARASTVYTQGFPKQHNENRSTMATCVTLYTDRDVMKPVEHGKMYNSYPWSSFQDFLFLLVRLHYQPTCSIFQIQKPAGRSPLFYGAATAHKTRFQMKFSNQLITIFSSFPCLPKENFSKRNYVSNNDMNSSIVEKLRLPTQDHSSDHSKGHS